MTQPIDTAYVDIVARGEDDAAREIARALNKIAAEVKKLTESIEKEFAQAGRDMEGEVQQATKSIERDLERQSRAAKKTGTSLALAMKEASESAANSIDNMADEATRDLARVEHAAERAAVAVALAGKAPSGGGGGGGGDGGGGVGVGLPDFDYVGRHRDIDRMSGALSGLANLAGTASRVVGELAENLGNRLANAGRQAAMGLGTLVGVIGSVLGPIGSLVAGMGMLGIALVLTPIIIPLVAALAQLAGLFALLPGAIGVLVAAFAPLFMAFSGIGDAVKALASGNLEKIDKAMQNLSPSARKFAVEIFTLKDRLKELRKTVQEAFFEKFNGSITELVDRLLPSLRSGLSWVSSNLGKLGADLTDTLSSAKAVSALNDLFATTGRIIDDLRGPLMSVVDSLLGGMQASLPFVERMFKSLGDGLQKFSDWLNDAVEDGRFQKWLEDAFDVAKQLWDLLKAVGGLIGAVFSPDSADEGKSIIESITEAVKELTEYLKSEEGKQQLHELAQAGKDMAAAIILITDAVTKFEGAVAWVKDSPLALLIPLNVMGRFEAFKSLWDSMWPSIKDFATDVGGWFKDAGSSIGDFFGDVGRWFEDTWNTVTEKGGEILQWFQDLPGKIGEFLSGLPETISNAFQTASDKILYWIGYAFGFVLSETIALPGRIEEGLKTLWQKFSDWFTKTRDDVIRLVTETWDKVTEWFDKLPGRVSSALSDMWNKVSDWFSRTRKDAVNAASNTIDKVVEWFQKLPGRASDAIQKLPGKIADILREIVTKARNIGSDIMNGIADGIRNGWNAAINAAKDAARQVLSGFWDAFDINSPSKLMIREVGMPIMEGVGVGIEKGTSSLSAIIKSSATRMMSDIQRAISPVESTNRAFATDLLAALKNPTGSDLNLMPNSTQEDFSWSGMDKKWTDEIRFALADQLGLNFLDAADAQKRIEEYLSQTSSQVPSQAPSQALSQVPSQTPVAGGAGSSIVIQNLTIPIQGVWDMTDPTASRRIAHNIYEALENLKRDYR